MVDNKIVDLDSFRKKTESKKISPREQATQICESTMYDMMSRLEADGFDIKDPDLQCDLEIISGLIIAALCRQLDVKNKSIRELIEILDDLRGDDKV